MRFRLLTISLLLLAFTQSSSFAHDIHAVDRDRAEQVTEGNSKPNMTELFGPDYKKGDIGHSFGTLKNLSTEGRVVIEHSKIHGTEIEASTTEFEVLPGADLSELTESNRVEFLIKKGDDDGYRVLSICKVTAENSKCL